MRKHLFVWLFGAGVSLIVSGCLHEPDAMPLAGPPQYGLAPRAQLAEPSPYEVSGMPPEPLYEQMTDAPGDGQVWVDGYWHWNGDEWVWVSGRWEEAQEGYAYVPPYYGYDGGAYYYTPGYWRDQRSLPAGWSVTSGHGHGRPPIVSVPTGWHPTPVPGRPGGVVGTRPSPGRGGTYVPPAEYPTGPYRTVGAGQPPIVESRGNTGLYPAVPVGEREAPRTGGVAEPAPERGERPAQAAYPSGGQRSGPIETEHPVYNPPPERPPPPMEHPSAGGGNTTVIYNRPAPSAPAPSYAPPPTHSAPSAPPPSAPPSHAGSSNAGVGRHR